MKKIKKIIICLVVLFSFSTFVNAACNNEELNEWATKVEAKFIEIKELGLNSRDYAYLLSITPQRDDITIKVTDGSGNVAEGTMLSPSSKEDKILAVGCFTNLEEETYTIEVYGGKNSACANELLKVMKYTVPKYNEFIKDKRCTDSDSELCKTFTNATKDMTEEEFNKKIEKETSNNEDNKESNILSIIIDYGLYIIIPLVLISIVYGIKINKLKKEERNR